VPELAANYSQEHKVEVKQVQALVVGGGPSGLSLAYGLQGDTLILERESSVGGLCRSITHDGGVFDIGGHSFHTPHPEVYELIMELMDGQVCLQQRDARVFSHGVLLPYPFQKYYEQIPDEAVVKACEVGLQNALGNTSEAENFEDYIIRKFGTGIAEHFMLPYNRKLWARDIKRISCEWTSERVAAPKGQDEKFDTSGGHRKPLQPTTQVGYPTQGGFEEFYRHFVPHIPGVELNSTVAQIDPLARTCTTTDGRIYKWEFLVSTMPIPELLRIINGAPRDLIEIADKLEYMSLRVELLLTGQPLTSTIQRIYIADPAIPPHKIALNHNSSEYLRQQPYHAITAEVSLSEQKPVDTGEIASRTIAFLCDHDILHAPDDIIWTGHIDVKYAYPIYTHDRPQQVERIRTWLAQYDIRTLGRFGEWEYINSDKCVMKGLQMARELRRQYPH